jgi:hypothetical protein
VLTNGASSLVMDGPNVYLDVAGTLQISASRTVGVSGGQVTIDGSPGVYLNCGQARPPQAEPLLVEVQTKKLEREAKDSSTAQVTLQFEKQEREIPGPVREAEKQARKQYGDLQQRRPDTPSKVRLPSEVNEQLDRSKDVAQQKRVTKDRVLEPERYEQSKRQLREELTQEKRRLQDLDQDLTRTFERHRKNYIVLIVLIRERREREIVRIVQNRPRPTPNDRPHDPTDVVRETCRRELEEVRKLRADLVTMLEQEREQMREYQAEWQSLVEEARAEVEKLKEVVEGATPSPPDAPEGLNVGEPSTTSPPTSGSTHPSAHPDVAHPSPTPLSPAEGMTSGSAPSISGSPKPMPSAGGGAGASPSAAPGMASGAAHSPASGLKPLLSGGAGSGMGAASGMASVAKPVTAGSAVALGPGAAGASSAMRESIGATLGQPPELRPTEPMMLTRMGGLVAEDVAGTVSPSQVGFLQTPTEGQLMVVPSDRAAQLSPAEVQSTMLDAQMDGRPVKSAVSGLLAERGYAVYERAWGDFWSEFVRVAGRVA